MRLRNEQMFPPGGWQFTDPKTQWKIPDPRSTDLNTAVSMVIGHRRANSPDGPTDPVVVKSEIIEFTCQRLMRELPQTAWKDWLCAGDVLPESKKNFLHSRPSQPSLVKRVVAHIAERLAALPNGLKVMAEWVGEGCEPERQDIVERRASICATCPENADSSFYDLITGPIADSIKRVSQLKSHLTLETKNDGKLGVCDVCGCHLKTKIWVPKKHVVAHTKFSRKLPAHCWIEREQ